MRQRFRFLPLLGVCVGIGFQARPLEAAIGCDAASLRAAITASNTSGATIDLPSGCTITFTDASPSGDNSALPVITGNFTINGNGVRLLRDVSSAAFRLFSIASSSNLTVRDALLALGQAPGGSSGTDADAVETATNGGDGQHGGAIYNRGNLVLERVTLDSNRAGNGGVGGACYGGLISAVSRTGGNGGRGGDGGAIWTDNTVEIRDSYVVRNESGAGGAGLNCNGGSAAAHAGGGGSSGSGGAIWSAPGSVVVIKTSTLWRNVVSDGAPGGVGNGGFNNNGAAGDGGSGGAIASYGALSILASTIDQNNAGNGAVVGVGGGIASFGTALDIQRTTISYNNTGSVGTSGGGGGGGLYVENAPAAALTNTTIAGNRATPGCASGGGIFVGPAGGVTLTNVTIAENRSALCATGFGEGGAIWSAGTVSLRNSIVTASAVYGRTCFGPGTFVDGTPGHNIARDEEGAFDNNGCPATALFGDPSLADLPPPVDAPRDPALPPETLRPEFFTVAVDAGVNAFCPAVDERGVTRPQGVNCEIGAYESTMTMLTQPGDLTVDEPASASFTAIIDAERVFLWAAQWQRQEAGSSTWTDIDGATELHNVTPIPTSPFSSTYVLNPSRPQDRGAKFRVVFFSASYPNGFPSDAATLTVNYGPTVIQPPPPGDIITVNRGSLFTLAWALIAQPPVQVIHTDVSKDNNGFCSAPGATWAPFIGDTGQGGAFVTPFSLNLMATEQMYQDDKNGHPWCIRTTFVGAPGRPTAISFLVVHVTAAFAGADFLTTLSGAGPVDEQGQVQISVLVTGSPIPTVGWQVSTDGGAHWSDIANQPADPYGYSFSTAPDAFGRAVLRFRAKATQDQYLFRTSVDQAPVVFGGPFYSFPTVQPLVVRVPTITGLSCPASVLVGSTYSCTVTVTANPLFGPRPRPLVGTVFGSGAASGRSCVLDANQQCTLTGISASTVGDALVQANYPHPSDPVPDQASSGSATVHVSGCAVPVITTCAPAQSAVCAGGPPCGAAAPDFRSATVVTDLPTCTGTTVAQSPAPNTALPFGANPITLTATNDAGSASCTTTFHVLKPPTLAVTPGSTTLTMGAPMPLTFTLTDPGNGVPVTGVGFTATLPSVLGVANGTFSACGGTVTATAATTTPVGFPVPATITLTGATVTAGAPCTFAVTVKGRALGSGQVTTNAVTTANAGTGASATSAVITVADGPPIVTKTFASPTVPLNGTVDLTFEVENANAALWLSGVSFTDTLPAGLEVASDIPAVSVCSGTFSASSATNQITFTRLGTLFPGTSCSLGPVSIRGVSAGVKTNAVAGTATETGSASVTTTADVTVVTGLDFTKAFAPASIPASGTSRLTFTIVNSNAAALTGIQFNDIFPPGLSLAPTPNLSTTCSGTPSTFVGGLQLSGATLAPGDSCTLQVDVEASSLGQKLNHTQPISTNETGSGAVATATLWVLSPPTIALSFIPSTVSVGQSATLRFTLSHPFGIGAPDLTGVAVSDTLNPPLSALPTTFGACGGTVTVGTGSIDLTGATITPGTPCTFDVMVSAGLAGNITNTTGTVTSANGGTGGVASAALTVIVPPTITQQLGVPAIPLNGTTWLTFAIRNPSGAFLSNVGFTDSLPAGLVVRTPNGLIHNCPGGLVSAPAGGTTIQLSGASFSAPSGCDISVDVMGTSYGAKDNTVTLTSDQGVSAPHTATLVVLAPVTVTKSFGAPWVGLGGYTTMTFRLTNPNATQPVSGISFQDDFPAGLIDEDVGSSALCGGTLSAGSSSVDFFGGTLGAGGTCDVVVPAVRATAAGSLNNTTAAVSSSAGAGTTSNTATLEVLAPPDFTLSFSPTLVPVGGTSTLTVSLTNPPGNHRALTGILFSDYLASSDLSPVSTGSVPKCGGTLTTSSSQMDFAGGSLPVGATCSFDVIVTAGSGGVWTNVTTPVVFDGGGQGGNATATLTVALSAAFTTAFNPTSITVGGTSTLTFSITNPPGNAFSLTGVGFTDVLPAGVDVADGTITTCGGTLTTTAGTRTIKLSGATVASGGTCTFDVAVTGSTPGVKANSVSVTTNETGTGPTATASLTVVGPPTITKSFGAATIPLNGSTTLTFTVGNTNTVTTLSGVGFTDTLPAGLVISTPNGLANNTCAGTLTAGAGTGAVTLSGESLAAATSCAFTVNVTGTTAGVKNNTTSAVASTEGGTGSAATASVTVLAPPVIATSINPATIAKGATTSLDFTITNPNVLGLVGVGLADTLPAGLTVVGAVTSPCGGTLTTTSPTSIVLSGATVANGTPCVFSLTVTGAVEGAYTNTTGNVTSTNCGVGNAASASLTVAVPPSITKSFGAATIPLGGTTSLMFTITAAATNPIDLTGVAFTDTLPAGLVVATPGGLTGTCGVGTITAADGGGAVSLAGATLQPNSSCSFFVNVKGATAGKKTNTVTVTSTEVGPGSPSTADLIVIAPPLIVKSFGTGTLAKGSSTTLTFTLTNPNTDAGAGLAGVGFDDPLPSGLAVATPNGLDSTCAGGSVTATAGGGAVSMTGATIGASASCAVTVNVMATIGGPKTNVTGAVTSSNGGTGLTATASLTVTAPADLAITNTDNRAIAIAGASLVYTITATNAGPNAAPGVTVTDSLPAGIASATWTCAAAGGASCTASGTGSINDTAVSLPFGGTATYTVLAQVSNAATGTLVNTATIAGPSWVLDPNGSNDSQTDTDTVRPRPRQSDFDGDGKADVVLYNRATRDVRLWLTTGTGPIVHGDALVGVGEVGARVVGVGDYDGDGKSDLLWYSGAGGGSVFLWTNVAGLSSAKTVLAKPVPAGMRIFGSGDYNEDGASDILWFNPATGDITLWLSEPGSLPGLTVYGIPHFADWTSAWTPVASGDYDNDGRSDVFWQNSATQATRIWFSNGSTGPVDTTLSATGPAGLKVVATGNYSAGDNTADVVWHKLGQTTPVVWSLNGATAPVSNPATGTKGATFEIVGSGDYDGNGTADLLWRDRATGTVDVWFMGGTAGNTVLSTGSYGAPPVPGRNWYVVPADVPGDISDFNGDGTSDLIWQDLNGTPVVWYLGGTTFSGAGDLISYIGSPTGWRIAGSADFNHDGQADLIAQNGGSITFALMSGKTVQSALSLTPSPGASWSVRAVGDFDGDGQTDLVWQDTAGRVVIWLMNGTSYKSGSFVYGSPLPGWTVCGAGDFTGDGQPDLLLQYDNGAVVVWPMNGTTLQPGVFVYNAALPGWKVRGAADLDGDGQTDIVLQYQDGQVAAWLMNGTSIQSGVFVYSAPLSGWTVRTLR